MFSVGPVGPVVDPRFPARSGWGDERAYRKGWHEGLDFATPIGSPVFALAAGTVILSARSSGVEGEWIVLEHAWGVSRYMHLESRYVKVGQRVIMTQPIGLSGASGIQRSEAHLHFDLGVRAPLAVAYAERYGTPTIGPGKTRTYAGHAVVSVPAEPIVPASLSDRVLANARTRKVALRGGAFDSIAIGVVADLATKGGLI